VRVLRHQGAASTPKLPTEVLVERLRAELHHRPDVRIAVGALCDAYPDVEQRLGVTRAAIEVLVEEEGTFGITTKGTTVLRDADLLRTGGRASVTVSLCSTDDAVLRQFDSRAPRVAERLGVVL
jgi:DNA repair photolyase